MGKQHLTFGDMRQDDDLSYIEAKVRSVILGEGNGEQQVRHSGLVAKKECNFDQELLAF